eukprot:TRINITY_DN3830_c0_g1_i2.p1 TRINITY_DN3830_c0_g1~~TRINITY_DN3830_c0_g1_i2.p1  ORF type:complete len:357 (-),score=47.64 TRINITY_DN3830_c0_g1_i2:13-1083(-)
MAKEGLADCSRPLLGTPSGYAVKRTGSKSLFLVCAVYLLLSVAAPIILDWLKRAQGGHFQFSVAALTFHAYVVAAILGVLWTTTLGPGLRALYSMYYLNAGSFSLLGKSFSMAFTVVLSRCLLGRKQSYLQYSLCVGIGLSTLAFCHFELVARKRLAGGSADSEAASSMTGASDTEAENTINAVFILGMCLRLGSSFLASLASVMQERILKKDAQMHFMMQQVWMSGGALLVGYAALRLRGREGGPGSSALSQLVDGFDDVRVLLLLGLFVCHGLMAGLLVKKLGALTKALCTPFVLGGCYTFAVCFGSAPLAAEPLAAWLVCALLIVAYMTTRIGVGGSAEQTNVASKSSSCSEP